jgi:hypothetical protein
LHDREPNLDAESLPMPASPNRIAEVLVAFDELVAAEDGTTWRARVLGAPNDIGHWEGWIEFSQARPGPAGDGALEDWIPTERETTQPNRTDLAYWATGLSAVYLQGALQRARRPELPRAVPAPTFVASRGPAPHHPAAPSGVVRHPVLDPFSVYSQGEQVLRAELHALSPDHLRTIASAYSLDLAAGDGDLADRIVAAVRREVSGPRA